MQVPPPFGFVANDDEVTVESGIAEPAGSVVGAVGRRSGWSA